LCLIALVAAGACGTSAPTPNPKAGSVSVLASWVGDELDAFNAVLRPFEKRTGITVTYAQTRDLRGQLSQRIADGHPPDVAGLDGPSHMRELARMGRLRDLGAVLDMGEYRTSVAPSFIELGTVDGRLVGVFLRSSLKGLVWFNPHVYSLGPPRTWS